MVQSGVYWDPSGKGVLIVPQKAFQTLLLASFLATLKGVIFMTFSLDEIGPHCSIWAHIKTRKSHMDQDHFWPTPDPQRLIKVSK